MALLGFFMSEKSRTALAVAHANKFPTRLERRRGLTPLGAPGPCPACKARAGVACTTKAGSPTKKPHKQRGWPRSSERAIVLHPVFLSKNAKWTGLSSGNLVAGIRVQGMGRDRNNQASLNALIAYAPTLVPAHWADRSFCLVVEHETPSEGASYTLNLAYGCSDARTSQVVKNRLVVGKAGVRTRLAFTLDPTAFSQDELSRFTLEVERQSKHPIVICGAWLEVRS